MMLLNWLLQLNSVVFLFEYSVVTASPLTPVVDAVVNVVFFIWIPYDIDALFTL